MNVDLEFMKRLLAKTRGTFWDLFFCLFLCLIVFSQTYRPQDLIGYVQDDIYQDMANAFREGRLAVLENASKAFIDTVPMGDRVFVVWGPFPALVYAALDAPLVALGLLPFPKALLFFIVCVFHLYFALAILRRFLTGLLWLPRIILMTYALSCPFWYIGYEALRVNYVSILFSTTSMFSGLYYLSKAIAGPQANLAKAAVLFGLSGLSRALTFVPIFALAGLVLLGLRRRAATFFAIVSASASIFLLYNYARFGTPFEFGEGWLNQGRWDEQLYGADVLPADPLRAALRFLLAFCAYFGLPPPETTIDTLYQYEQTFFGLRQLPWLLAAFFGACLWLRQWSANLFPLGVFVCALSAFSYHLLFGQDQTIRYQFDYAPLFMLAGAAGLGEIREKPKIFLPIFCVFTLLPVVLNLALHKHLVQELSVQRGQAIAYPHRIDGGMDGMMFFLGQKVQSELRCEEIKEALSGPEDISERQRDLRRIGIYRFSDGRCEISFFSAIILRVAAGNVCKVELDLEESSINDCARVRLYADGRFVGRMQRSAAAPPGILRCEHEVSQQGIVKTRFVIDPVPYRSEDWLRKSPRYGFFGVRTRCFVL